MRIFHCETNVWNRIHDQNDVHKLTQAFEFENSQIIELRFKRSANILETGADPFKFIPDALFAVFDNRLDLTKQAGTKRIEMLFGNVDKLNFRPENLSDIDTLDTVVIKFADGYWYFGDIAYKNTNQYGYCDDATWLRCDTVFWRKIDYSIDKEQIKFYDT